MGDARLRAHRTVLRSNTGRLFDIPGAASRVVIPMDDNAMRKTVRHFVADSSHRKRPPAKAESPRNDYP